MIGFCFVLIFSFASFLAFSVRSAKAATVSRILPMAYEPTPAPVVESYGAPGGWQAGVRVFSEQGVVTPNGIINEGRNENWDGRVPNNQRGLIKRVFMASVKDSIPSCAINSRVALHYNPEFKIETYGWGGGDHGVYWINNGLMDWPESQGELRVRDGGAGKPLPKNGDFVHSGVYFEVTSNPPSYGGELAKYFSQNFVSITPQDLADGIIFPFWVETYDQVNNIRYNLSNGTMEGREWVLRITGGPPSLKVEYEDDNCGTSTPKKYNLDASFSIDKENKLVHFNVKNIEINGGVSRKGDGVGVTVTREITINGAAVRPENRKVSNDQQIIPGENRLYDDPINGILNTSDEVCAKIIVSPKSGTTDGAADPGDEVEESAALCITIKAKPYFRVYGNDVVVGRQFMSGGTCLAKNPNAHIDAFNSGSGSDYKGAGVQFAASATNVISGFMSASMYLDTPTPTIPDTSTPDKGLSFSNNSSPAGNDTNGYTGCVGDYEAIAQQHGGFTNGDITIDPILNNYTPGNVLSIRGNLIINSNIGPSTTDYDNLNNISPNLFIVKGNIYISKDVTDLDGLFVAIPDGNDPNSGTINTCGATNDPAADPNLNCKDNPLTITGAFMAKKVLFNRLNGDLAGATANEDDVSANIAEKFIFTPDFYLGLINYLPNNDSVIGSNKYDSVVSLPPVL